MYMNQPMMLKYESHGGSTCKFLYVVRLQYSLYFCVFKYVQAIKQKG